MYPIYTFPFTCSKKTFHKKRRISSQQRASRSFIKMFLSHLNHLISDAAKENSLIAAYLYVHDVPSNIRSGNDSIMTSDSRKVSRDL